MVRSANMLTIVFSGVLLLIANHSLAEQEASAEPLQAEIASADPAVGEKVFLQCRACHTVDKSGKHAFGPSLWGVLGRKVGSAPGYGYSAAMVAKGGVWGFENLDLYLRNPGRFIPNTRMAFPGIQRSRDRVNVIAYLRSLSDAPLPLPAGSKKISADSERDPQAWDGLPPGPGREEVFYTCQACHSLRIVQQQGLSRDSWDETLAWMVEDQGMEKPDAKTRKLILGYLAEHFGQSLKQAK